MPPAFLEDHVETNPSQSRKKRVTQARFKRYSQRDFDEGAEILHVEREVFASGAERHPLLADILLPVSNHFENEDAPGRGRRAFRREKPEENELFSGHPRLDPYR